MSISVAKVKGASRTVKLLEQAVKRGTTHTEAECATTVLLYKNQIICQCRRSTCAAY